MPKRMPKRMPNTVYVTEEREKGEASYYLTWRDIEAVVNHHGSGELVGEYRLVRMGKSRQAASVDWQ